MKKLYIQLHCFTIFIKNILSSLQRIVSVTAFDSLVSKVLQKNCQQKTWKLKSEKINSTCKGSVCYCEKLLVE